MKGETITKTYKNFSLLKTHTKYYPLLFFYMKLVIIFCMLSPVHLNNLTDQIESYCNIYKEEMNEFIDGISNTKNMFLGYQFRDVNELQTLLSLTFEYCRNDFENKFMCIIDSKSIGSILQTDNFSKINLITKIKEENVTKIKEENVTKIKEEIGQDNFNNIFFYSRPVKSLDKVFIDLVCQKVIDFDFYAEILFYDDIETLLKNINLNRMHVDLTRFNHQTKSLLFYFNSNSSLSKESLVTNFYNFLNLQTKKGFKILDLVISVGENIIFYFDIITFAFNIMDNKKRSLTYSTVAKIYKAGEARNSDMENQFNAFNGKKFEITYPFNFAELSLSITNSILNTAKDNIEFVEENFHFPYSFSLTSNQEKGGLNIITNISLSSEIYRKAYDSLIHIKKYILVCKIQKIKKIQEVEFFVDHNGILINENFRKKKISKTMSNLLLIKIFKKNLDKLFEPIKHNKTLYYLNENFSLMNENYLSYGIQRKDLFNYSNFLFTNISDKIQNFKQKISEMDLFVDIFLFEIEKKEKNFYDLYKNINSQMINFCNKLTFSRELFKYKPFSNAIGLKITENGVTFENNYYVFIIPSIIFKHIYNVNNKLFEFKEYIKQEMKELFQTDNHLFSDFLLHFVNSYEIKLFIKNCLFFRYLTYNERKQAIKEFINDLVKKIFKKNEKLDQKFTENSLKFQCLNIILCSLTLSFLDQNVFGDIADWDLIVVLESEFDYLDNIPEKIWQIIQKEFNN